jgi:predicted metal-dependent peptidase
MLEIGAHAPEISGEVGKWERLQLSSAHDKLWTETRAAMLWAAPAFADVFLGMMVDDHRDLAWFTDKIRTAATDGTFLYVNPEKFFKYSLEERVFIVCHEICHCIFDHCGMIYYASLQKFIKYVDGTSLPYIDQIMQIAMDCLINDLVFNSHIGKMPKGACHLPNLITQDDNLFDAYRKLYKKFPSPSGGRGGTQSQGQGNKQKGQGQGTGVGQGQQNNKDYSGNNERFDEHLAPGTGRGVSPTSATQNRNQQAWDNAVRAAMKAAKDQGRLPAGLERGFAKLLEPKVDWREHLIFVTSKMVGRDCSTWSLLDNELMLRGIGAPGKKGHGCQLIVFAADSSGSIDQNTMNMFMTECASIVENIRPRQVIFMQCDAQVYDYTEIEEPDDLVRRLRGGGGTDFRPVFQRIQTEGLEPDCLVYLTDLEGAFPQTAPEYPVIWGTIRDHSVPFGEKVLVPQQANSES